MNIWFTKKSQYKIHPKLFYQMPKENYFFIYEIYNWPFGKVVVTSPSRETPSSLRFVVKSMQQTLPFLRWLLPLECHLNSLNHKEIEFNQDG